MVRFRNANDSDDLTLLLSTRAAVGLSTDDERLRCRSIDRYRPPNCRTAATVCRTVTPDDTTVTRFT